MITSPDPDHDEPAQSGTSALPTEDVTSANGPIARVQPVVLREVWKHEQTGFSRWLLENIDFLNEHLPFDVDPESILAEAPAGDFAVDLVCDAVGPESPEPFKVVVENQLELTDHRHLGQVMTYLAAYEATAAIWISAGARPEHAKAVQWLNDESTIDAWLFDIEVVRIDDSRPAPLLRRIIGPSDLSRRAKADRQENLAEKQHRQDLWAEILPKVAVSCADYGVWQDSEPVGSVYIFRRVPGSPARIGWEIWLTAHGTWICLRVDGGSDEEADHYFELLRGQQTSVESAFGSPLTWQSHESSRSSAIRWDNPAKGGYDDDESLWGPAAENLADAMQRLVGATIDVVPGLTGYEDAADTDSSENT